MVWFWLAFGSAFSESLNYVVSKKALRNVEPGIISLSFSLFGIPWLLLAALASGPIEVKEGFWTLLCCGGLLYGIGRILFVEAIKSSPLSVTIPMGAFAPIFLLITSPLLLGEYPTTGGLLGVLITFAGSYALNFTKISEGLFAPFQALLRERGPRLMLCTAFLWSIASIVDKLGVQTANPALWVLGLNVIMSALAAVYCWQRKILTLSAIIPHLRALTIIGGISAATLLLYVSAVQLTFVAYASAVKRFSPLFSVLFGWLFFRESGIRERLVGAFLMVLGSILLVLSS